ncbi:disease resistance protein RUN1-like [Gastrolobium bilobum]|uniref:disease resistance protein RUN1-like n=1 Tax=Gastrolobium bilobum TaxID=150636 RepID=UPI002AAF1817|nr:disease resistance protein RUN1-like [Gastrolobium bilobum]
MDCKKIQSSSSTRKIWKYDVFVSFRGDTRNNFTDHLFAALCRKGIFTFRDDTNLNKGESIAPELLKAIQGSQILIVVFSKNYASSTWCLQELAEIADCIQVSGQTVLPIFYDVNPSEVRKQSGSFEKAFVEHEHRFKENLEKVQRWRGALAQVANLSGWDISDKPQYAEIEKIIKKVRGILDRKFSSIPGDIVGIHSRVEELEKLLGLDSDDDAVRIVGICGMGGIGKSTLATVLYERISNQFDASCFVDDVSKIYGDYGPIGAQKQLCQILNEENLHMCNTFMATNLIRSRLCHVKSLIVLDNIDQVEQLEKLAVKPEWLGAGSRVIIISRDEHILREHGVDEVYKVKLLNYHNALQLFCRKAFKCDDIMIDFEKLTYDAVKYVNGLPLAIKVLGSFLFGRNVSEWRSALARLRENPRKDIMDVLRNSFDALEDMEKEIFLDIACLFYNRRETYVKEVLDFRGFHPEIGIRVLIDKSLITSKMGWIHVHDLLIELGRSIVREKSPKEPRKWSRLWNYKDLHNVMLENKTAENLEALVTRGFPDKIEETTMRADALSKMSHLKLLVLWSVNFSGSQNFLSNELGYLCWDKYPFASLPSSFQPDKLVELKLPNSCIKQLWECTKPLHSLKRMDLSHSRNLIKMPDFGEVPNLEWLNLEGCIKLERIHPSIGILRKLSYLNLKNCKNLVFIPNIIFDLSSLEVLSLSGCSKLLNNQLLEKPRHAEHMEKLDINGSTIQSQSTSSIYKIPMLPFRFFYSRRYQHSVGLLLPSLPRFPYLQHLDLSFCNILQIPDAIGWLHCLEWLKLGGNDFVTLPSSIKELSKLRYFNLEHCKQLKYLPELPSSTVFPVRQPLFSRYCAGLNIFDCPNLSESEMERCYNLAFCWMIQVLKVLMLSSIPFGHIHIVIPDTQIPRWFNKQNMGNSISMDSSPIMHAKNWIGVACCAAFVAHDDQTNLSDTSQPHIGFISQPQIGFLFHKNGRGRSPYIPIHLEKDLVTVESDHLMLLFFTREEFIDQYVKNCAYRWVFKEDLEQSNPKMMHSRNSLARKRKFLTNG